jgi:histidinol-phosphate aminotransferase
MSRFLSSRFDSLEAYTPGEQPQDKKYIKLNTNESPYPPSPEVISAVDGEAGALNLYSDPEGKLLREAIAEYYDVTPENVMLGNGSDEILSFAFMAFCDKTHGAAFPDISYGFYPVYGELYGIPYEEKPLREDFTIDIDDYLGYDGMVVIANPNAPTGICLSLADIERIVSANPNRVVLIDEAYVDFGAESAVPLTKKYDNLLVCQTYSKSRSLAGARLGYSIASRALTEDLRTMKYSFNPYNINRMTLAAGRAAIASQSYYTENCRRIIETREQTAQQLRELGFDLTDSRANFIFAQHPKISGEEYYLRLKEMGILVRHFGKARIADRVRITIGTPEQMQALVAATKKILEVL